MPALVLQRHRSITSMSNRRVFGGVWSPPNFETVSVSRFHFGSKEQKGGKEKKRNWFRYFGLMAYLKRLFRTMNRFIMGYSALLFIRPRLALTLFLALSGRIHSISIRGHSDFTFSSTFSHGFDLRALGNETRIRRRPIKLLEENVPTSTGENCLC